MSQISLNRHEVLGTLTYPQVDVNWTDIQEAVNQLIVQYQSGFPLNNLTATTDPTANDDITEGYQVRSLWFNTSSETLFILLDPTEGAADWYETDLAWTLYGTAALLDTGTLPGQIPTNADLGSAAFAETTDFVPSAREIIAGAGLTGGGNLSANRTLAIDFASTAEVIEGAADKAFDASTAFAAMAPVTSSGSGTFSPDLEVGINFYREVTGSSTVNPPTNAKLGQSGLIYIAQDGTGGHPVTFSGYRAIGGAPAIDDDPDAVNVFGYYVRSVSPLIVTLTYLGVEVTL